jgi:hypothetical protein
MSAVCGSAIQQRNRQSRHARHPAGRGCAAQRSKARPRPGVRSRMAARHVSIPSPTISTSQGAASRTAPPRHGPMTGKLARSPAELVVDAAPPAYFELEAPEMRIKYSLNIGTVNAVSPCAGLYTIPFLISELLTGAMFSTFTPSSAAMSPDR